MTAMTESVPRTGVLDRDVAMRLAATEYRRFADLLRGLAPADWATPTECPDWDVRQVAAHTLGMIEMAASVRETIRQNRAAAKRRREHGGVAIDALTGLQVDERAEMTPSEIMGRIEARRPVAARARRRSPAFVRRRRLPVAQTVGEHEETWTIGFLTDVILTCDAWMHRGDICRATGAPLELTTDHDAVLVADVVAEWAARHGEPYSLRLTGPAGGTWSHGVGGPELELDAVEFCRILSGRGTSEGPLATAVPF
ncbi:MAG: hypothetical protein BGO26_07120 [Actinobacteria bacterium 69-20]|nr:MAG: hypothetical protein BGO26_07120 [Actinobacteria bacterium 69-20]